MLISLFLVNIIELDAESKNLFFYLLKKKKSS